MPITVSGWKKLTDAGNASVSSVVASSSASMPLPTATGGGGGGGTVTHGSQITTTNTGHLAYFDPGLGRLVQESDLIVHTATVSASDFTTTGGLIEKRHFQSGIIMDITNVTFRACKVNGMWSGLYYDPNLNQNVHNPFHLEWCTAYTPGPADNNGMQYQDYTAYRCNISGSSDGGKINGNVTITECYIRCKGQSSQDHNDGLQNVGGVGDVIVQRCNIDCRPTNDIGAVNAALYSADNAEGLMTWTDNLLAGGGYTILCYENATFDVQGNWVIDGTWVYAPAGRGVIPQSNLTWGTQRSNYIVQDVSYTQLSVLAAP